MPINLKEHCKTELESCHEIYLKDLDALSADALTQTSGGVARSAIQFTYEVALVNKRLTKRLVGEDPGPFDPALFTSIPEEFMAPEASRKLFSETFQGLLAAFESYGEDEMDKEIPTPNGATSPFDLALFAAKHMTYHDGQLNLIQAINGDSDIHWH